jgi:carboxylate-amine ligase
MNKRKFREQFEFDPNKKLFVGIEEEHWLTDQEGNLTDKALDILRYAATKNLCFSPLEWVIQNGILLPKVEKEILPKLRFEVGLQPELNQAQIEITTKANPDPQSALANLISQRILLQELASQNKCKILPTATPIFPFRSQVFPLYHYRQVERIFAENIKSAFTSGLHVHLGVSNEKEAIVIFNYLREFLPELLALSANSPIVSGVTTGLHSNRYFRYRTVVGSAIPAPIKCWDSYYNELEKMRCADNPTRNY